MDVGRYFQDMLFHCERSSTAVLNMWYDADMCRYSHTTAGLSIQACWQDFKGLTELGKGFHISEDVSEYRDT